METSSTNEDKQNMNRHVRELLQAGAQKVIFEYEHGDAKVKHNLKMLLNATAEGYTIITPKISRLRRNTKQLCEIKDVIRESICG